MVADPKTINEEEEDKFSKIVIIGEEELEEEDKTGEDEQIEPNDKDETSYDD